MSIREKSEKTTSVSPRQLERAGMAQTVLALSIVVAITYCVKVFGCSMQDEVFLTLAVGHSG